MRTAPVSVLGWPTPSQGQRVKPAVEPSPEDVREELSAIRARERFIRSDRLCQFEALEVYTEGRGAKAEATS